MLMGFTIPNTEYKTAKFIIEDSSKIEIFASTNVNTIDCFLQFESVSPKLDIVYTENGNTIKFKKAQLKMANSCFDCGNKMINKDLLKMLDTDNNPHIYLNLKEVSLNSYTQNSATALISITMAGVTREAPLDLEIDKDRQLRTKGCLSLNLKDFEIDPPKKAMGLVAVQNEITINLDLIMKPVSE